MKNSLLHPKHPERLCWGCSLLCRADALACGNGSGRTPHPSELFGEDWQEFQAEADEASEWADADMVRAANDWDRACELNRADEWQRSDRQMHPNGQLQRDGHLHLRAF